MTCDKCIHYEACRDWINETALQKYVEDNGCDKFKDKSRIVELPCKVGEAIYILNANKTSIQKMILDNPDIRCHCVKDDEFECCSVVCQDRYNNICAYRFNNNFQEIGKTAFLTKRQAEQALKEREKNG